jgi:hypothetical protein
MKLPILALVVGSAAAFAPAAPAQSSTTQLNMEVQSSRKAFVSAAVATFGSFLVAPAAYAGTMGQEYVSDPTEQWESGKPTPEAEAARVGRYKNARTQMTSSFPPIKRLTLERKSPVERLDISAPNFTAYKKSYPGLYKKVE